MEILYEDNHVLALNKPAGIAVQAAKPGEEDLLSWLKQFLKVRDNKPGSVFVGLVHRIDRPVSGVVLFAKTSKGASRLSQQIRDGVIEKIYQAVVHGVPAPKIQRLTHRLEKTKHGKGYKALVVATGGDVCTLSFDTLAAQDAQSLLRIHLETGRFHQIRAQLAAVGHPIVGDTLYGSSKQLPHHEILLRAVSLSFNHVDRKSVV